MYYTAFKKHVPLLQLKDKNQTHRLDKIMMISHLDIDILFAYIDYLCDDKISLRIELPVTLQGQLWRHEIHEKPLLINTECLMPLVIADFMRRHQVVCKITYLVSQKCPFRPQMTYSSLRTMNKFIGFVISVHIC